MYKIGITGTGSLIGQAIIKSIIRSSNKDKYSLVGFDYFPDTVGSLWCNKNYILPDLLKAGTEEIWLKELTNIILNEKLNVLFVGVDFELPLLAEKKQEMESATNCKIIVSSKRVIEIGNDKYKTYQFLKDNGLYHPKTYLPSECDFSELAYPLIVKPRIGARSIGVYKVNNTKELERALTLANDPIIQECVGDDTTEYTCGVIALDGELKAHIALNRSLKEGNTFISTYKKDISPVLEKYLIDITKKLQPHGSCNFQLRIDKHGIPKMFEINPRHSGTTYIRSLFGYNEIIYILEFLLEGNETKFDLTEGKAIRFFEEALIK